MEASVTYDKAELRRIKGAFKGMDEAALDQAKRESSAIAEFLLREIQTVAAGRVVSGIGVNRTAQGGKVSKSSKIGEISFGFAGQRFSGGATTQILWPGLEFGSKRWKQFPIRNRDGYFIYPTLKANQAKLIAQWEAAFSEIVKKWDE